MSDRISSIELKILKTRFSFEFDGRTLSLLENQRKIKEYKARSGVALSKVNPKEFQQKNFFSLIKMIQAFIMI